MIPEDNIKTAQAPSKSTNATHEVGMNMTIHGCDGCPSSVYKTADGFPGVAFVFAGTLDGKNSIAEEGKPSIEMWTKYRVPWLAPLNGCAQFDEFPPKQEA